MIVALHSVLHEGAEADIGRHVAYFIGEEEGAAGQVLPLVYSLQAQRSTDREKP
ncbi:hypothetical protein ACXC9Q_23115 (plasmid) [Kribbella sp. CWNU-51]